MGLQRVVTREATRERYPKAYSRVGPMTFDLQRQIVAFHIDTFVSAAAAKSGAEPLPDMGMDFNVSDWSEEVERHPGKPDWVENETKRRMIETEDEAGVKHKEMEDYEVPVLRKGHEPEYETVEHPDFTAYFSPEKIVAANGDLRACAYAFLRGERHEFRDATDA